MDAMMRDEKRVTIFENEVEGGIKDPAPWLRALFSLAPCSCLPFLEGNDLD